MRFGDAWVKPDPAKSVSWEKAYGIPTEHFLVMSTLPRERALEIASDLEALYRIWEEILEGIGPARGEGENPKVWALQTAADLQACVAAIYPAGVETVRDPGTPGLAATNRNAFFDEQGPQRFGHSIRIGLFHEGSHLIHFDVPGSDVRSAPVWAVEGTAVLMETLETVKSPDWNAAAPPFRATARAFAAVVPEAVPALPGMDKPVFYQDNQTHYAQAFLLAHWLLYGHGGLHRADFLRYALGIGGGGEIPPCKGEALAGEIQRYLKSLKR